MNKLGGERVMSFYWFIIFVIVAIGVVSGVLMFFSSTVDVREIEANILADKLIDCFSDEGVLQSPESLEDCDLILDEEEFFVEVSLGEGIGPRVMVEGDQGFRTFCRHEGSTKNIPVCVMKSLFVLVESEERGERFVRLDVTAAVLKLGDNQK